MATIFYTIIGMPIFLLYMTNVGQILATSLKWFYGQVCSCSKKKDYNTDSVWKGADAILRGAAMSIYSPPESGPSGRLPVPPKPPKPVNIPITISLAIMITILCFGMKLFEYWEGWDAITSFYFCFVSLSTIGYGDYFPGVSIESEFAGNKMSFLYCALFLLFGLTLFSMCFNLMQEEVIHKVTSCLRIFTRRNTEEPS